MARKENRKQCTKAATTLYLKTPNSSSKLKDKNENSCIDYSGMDCAFSGFKATYFAKKGISKNYKKKALKVAQPPGVHYVA